MAEPIYTFKTGISYVYNNMAEVQHEVHEKIEAMEHSPEGLGNKTGAEWEQQLMRDEKIKVQRVDMDFARCDKNFRTINENPWKASITIITLTAPMEY